MGEWLQRGASGAHRTESPISSYSSAQVGSVPKQQDALKVPESTHPLIKWLPLMTVPEHSALLLLSLR